MRSFLHCGRLFLTSLFVLALTSTIALAKPPVEVPPVCSSIIMESESGRLTGTSYREFTYDEVRHVSLTISAYDIWVGSPEMHDIVYIAIEYLNDNGSTDLAMPVINFDKDGYQTFSVDFVARKWYIYIEQHTLRSTFYDDIYVAYNYTTTHPAIK